MYINSPYSRDGTRPDINKKTEHKSMATMIQGHVPPFTTITIGYWPGSNNSILPPLGDKCTTSQQSKLSRVLEIIGWVDNVQVRSPP
jgi:hypothetical protein